MCNRKRHYANECKDEKVKKIKENDMNHVFINLMMKENHVFESKKTSSQQKLQVIEKKTRSHLREDFYI